MIDTICDLHNMHGTHGHDHKQNMCILQKNRGQVKQKYMYIYHVMLIHVGYTLVYHVCTW